MKKYLLAAALVMASTSAMADRLVSGSSDSFLGGWDSKAEACESAKIQAEKGRWDTEQVESFSKCDCDKNSHGKWSCSVDAKLEKMH